MKINFVIGADADENLHQLYLGTDGQEAKDAYTEAINGGTEGITKVWLFIRPSEVRRHDVVAPPVAPPVQGVEAATPSKPAKAPKAPKASKPPKE
jgi:hypothetical protein